MYDALFKQLLHRPTASHKYDFGHVLVIGGSSGMVGAPFLAARAALRVGAGLVTIASDPPVTAKLERRVEEIMTLAVRTDSTSSITAVKDYIQARKVSVLIIGPGLTPHAKPLLSGLLTDIELPIVIDGGGLSILASDREVLQKHASNQLILTPHLGELQRFFKQKLPQDPTSLTEIAQQFAETEKVTLIVKGPATKIITGNGKIYTNTTGGPALATAGSGDVLSGIIAGILAQKISTPEEVPAAAVYLHGLAGDLAAQALTEPAVIASDIIEYIPPALKTYE